MSDKACCLACCSLRRRWLRQPTLPGTTSRSSSPPPPLMTRPPSNLLRAPMRRRPPPRPFVATPFSPQLCFAQMFCTHFLRTVENQADAEMPCAMMFRRRRRARVPPLVRRLSRHRLCCSPQPARRWERGRWREGRSRPRRLCWSRATAYSSRPVRRPLQFLPRPPLHLLSPASCPPCFRPDFLN